MTLKNAQDKARRIAEQDNPAIILEWFDGRKRDYIVTLESHWMSDTNEFFGMTDVEFVYREEDKEEDSD